MVVQAAAVVAPDGADRVTQEDRPVAMAYLLRIAGIEPHAGSRMEGLGAVLLRMFATVLGHRAIDDVQRLGD